MTFYCYKQSFIMVFHNTSFFIDCFCNIIFRKDKKRKLNIRTVCRQKKFVISFHMNLNPHDLKDVTEGSVGTHTAHYAYSSDRSCMRTLPPHTASTRAVCVSGPCIQLLVAVCVHCRYGACDIFRVVEGYASSS